MNEKDELMLSRDDLAKRWHVSVATIDRTIQREAIPTVKLGRSVRIPLSEVLRIERMRTVSNG